MKRHDWDNPGRLDLAVAVLVWVAILGLHFQALAWTHKTLLTLALGGWSIFVGAVAWHVLRPKE